MPSALGPPPSPSDGTGELFPNTAAGCANDDKHWPGPLSNNPTRNPTCHTDARPDPPELPRVRPVSCTGQSQVSQPARAHRRNLFLRSSWRMLWCEFLLERSLTASADGASSRCSIAAAGVRILHKTARMLDSVALTSSGSLWRSGSAATLACRRKPHIERGRQGGYKWHASPSLYPTCW